MKYSLRPLTLTSIALFASFACTACMADGVHKLGDWMESAETSMFGSGQKSAAPRVAGAQAATASGVLPIGSEGQALDLSRLTPEQLAQLEAFLAAQPGRAVPPSVEEDDGLDLAQLVTLGMLLSGEFQDTPMQILPDGTLVYGVQPTYAQGYPGAMGYPQPGAQFGQVGVPQQGMQGGNPGWAGAPGFDPNFYHDTHAYQDPSSVYYDPYEVDSEGWSGGAYENPSSNSYDSGSYDVGSSGGSYDN